MPALPLFIMEPLCSQFEALIPPVVDHHPLGCHRPRVPDQVIFEKLVQVLVLGAAYEKISDSNCSATTIRRRRDTLIGADIFRTMVHTYLAALTRVDGV